MSARLGRRANQGEQICKRQVLSREQIRGRRFVNVMFRGESKSGAAEFFTSS